MKRLLAAAAAAWLLQAPAAPAAAPQAYRTSVLAADPALYWRYGETEGTTITDASPHARHGSYVVDNFVNEGVELGRPGALADDPDTAFGKSSTYLYYGATFARRASAAGLPSGDQPRTVTGWTRFTNTVVL